MKKIKYGIAALALGVSLALSGCSPQGAYYNPSYTYANDECTASPDNPTDLTYPTTDGTGIHTAKGSLTNNVVGHVYVSCLPSPIQHYLDMELWFHSLDGNGQFHMVSDTHYRSIPNKNNPTNFIVARWCQPGIWELRWSVVGKDYQGAPFAYSGRWTFAFVKASDCDRAAIPEPSPTQTGDGPVAPE